MRAIVIEPHKNPRIREIENELSSLQNAVGGYIEVVNTPISELLLIICEEGKIQKMEPNCLCSFGNRKDVLVGTIVVAGQKGVNFTSVTDKQIKDFRKRIKTYLIPLDPDVNLAQINGGD